MKTHRKLFFTLLIASTTGIIHAQNVFNDPAVNEEQRLDDLIARMTLDEKSGCFGKQYSSPPPGNTSLRKCRRPARSRTGRTNIRRQSQYSNNRLSASLRTRRNLGYRLTTSSSNLHQYRKPLSLSKCKIPEKRTYHVDSQCRLGQRSSLGTN